MTAPSIREARLLPAYASLYPDMKPGVWLPACSLAEFVLERGLYQRRSGSPAKRRLLNESHFEFRAARPRLTILTAGPNASAIPTPGVSTAHRKRDAPRKRF